MDTESIGEIVAQRYVIEQALRHGVAGTVYRARHVKLPREFALQIIPRDAIADAARLEATVAQLERVRDPASAGIVDGGELPDGRRYLVRDWPGGEPLRGVTIEGARVLPLLRELAGAIAALHASGIVHGELDARSLVIDRDREGREHVHVVDVGPGLVAPVDVHQDLVALGAIAFELLGGTPLDAAAEELRERFDTPRLGTLRADADPLVEVVARRLLARSRARQIASAHEVCELLDLIVTDRAAAAARLGVDLAPRTPPPAHAPPPIVYVPRSFAPAPRDEDLDDDLDVPPRSSRGRLALAFLAGLLVLGIGGALVLRTPPADRATARVVARPPAAAPETATLAPPAIAAVDETPPVAAVEPPPPPIARNRPRRGSVAPIAPVRGGDAVTPAATHGEEPAPSALAVEPVAEASLPGDAAAPTQPPTADELAAHYADVGRALRELHQRAGRPATLELWPRFRRIRLNAVIARPEDRAQITRELAALQRDIAARAP